MTTIVSTKVAFVTSLYYTLLVRVGGGRQWKVKWWKDGTGHNKIIKKSIQNVVFAAEDTDIFQCTPVTDSQLCSANLI